MARTIGKLTALGVTQAKKRGYYSDGGGLFLQVSASGSKSWVFRFREAGRLHEMGLGPTHTVTLAEARQKALDCRKLRLEGHDPIAERRAKRMAARLEAAKGITFQECASAYIAAHKAGWRNAKHAAQWPFTLATYAYPKIGVLPVQAVDVGLVLAVVEPIWSAKPETASRLRGRIESVLDWASARGYRTGENPARWRGHLDNLLPPRSKVKTVEHHAALPYREVADFMAEIRQVDGVAARALEFTILTAARTGEVIGANWDEFDLAEAIWLVPAERMKAGKEHRVPLSAAAIGVLKRLGKIRQSDFVFPGGKPTQPISNMAMLMLLRRLGCSHLTVHGFRSSFRDWAAEQTSFPAEVAEMALAHSVSNQVEAAYRRGDLFDKRRQLAEDWAAFCHGNNA
ncbi:MAG: tyrosine-type recombinase/integrase [Thiohalocapsa sp.]